MLLEQRIKAFDVAAEPKRPRLLKGDRSLFGIVEATKYERKFGFDSMAEHVLRRNIDGVDGSIVKKAFTSADPVVRANSLNESLKWMEGAAESAFAFYVTSDSRYLDELSHRISAFAPTIVKNNCSDGIYHKRDYVWYFAVAYDFVQGHVATDGKKLSDTDKKNIVDLVTACTGTDEVKTLAQKVIDSPNEGTVFNGLSKFVGAHLLLRGDPNFSAAVDKAWLDNAIKTYVTKLPNWGGDSGFASGPTNPADGGYSNGSAYLLYDTSESLLSWDAMERVLDYPLYSKPYLQHLPEFIVFTTPPGSPAGAFGDGAESPMSNERARLGKSIMNRLDSNFTRWFVANSSGDDPSRLSMLLSKRAKSAVPQPTEYLSAAFPSVGIAALHSSFEPDRLSILFKGSTPFGSVNHAHADQNSFVIYNKGKILAMDSGYYDDYNSAHRRLWSKQTKAHNAITFDVGQGQYMASDQGSRTPGAKPITLNPGAARPSTSVALTASLTVPGTPSVPYDIVTSDAAPSYGGALTKALRTLVYLRSMSTVVIVDQLASETARTWEYNLHTTVAPELLASGDKWGELKFNVASNTSLCVKVADQNGMSRFSHKDGYKTPPKDIKPSPHYWNIFSSKAKTKTATIVSILRIDCANPQPNENLSFWASDVASVSVGTVDIDISPNGIVVR